MSDLSESAVIVSMDGSEVLDVNPREFFLRQLLIGGEDILDTSGFDFAQIVQVSWQ